jgi:ABC-type sugar transport system permease subunit
MTERYWFRPKSFGYGATPVTWEGWLVTLSSVVVTGIAIIVAILTEVHEWPDRRIYQVICLIVVAVMQFATILVSRRKTSGEWRWRP